jgi:DnaJ like chaperone protein
VAQQVFYQTVFRLMGHLAKVDGHISEQEIDQAEAFMAQMGLTEEHRREAIGLFKEGAAGDFSIDDAMIRFQSSCGHYRQLQQILLEYLFHIAFADGELHAAERQSLASIANWLGIAGAAFERLLQMYHAQYGFARGNTAQRSGADQLANAYQALGVDAKVSDRELKRAYRRLMSQHHPDKLIAQGVPEDMLKVATEKSQEISAAYDLILDSRTRV